MTAPPEVSVVMGVFNAGPYLRPAVESVLRQEDVDLELIIVNDGSVDGSAAVAEGYSATDRRVRVLHQENTGLTRALIRGCGAARGDYIARQDAEDVSVSHRIRRQLDRLAAHSGESLVSCWADFIGPEGELLFTSQPEDAPAEVTRRLRGQGPATQRGIVHGSALFRRHDYERAGGYREQFYFVQDLDLWLRLTDSGLAGVVPETLYQLRVTPSSLSSRYQPQQAALARIALDLARCREAGGDEDMLLSRASAIRPGPGRGVLSGTDRASGFYFIGKCLLARRDPRATRYLGAAVRRRPWDLRAWAALGRSTLGSL